MPVAPRMLRGAATALAACLVAAAAHAQRADENAVRSAEDAFGATIGRETIGLYSPDDVRGFSAVAAGNLRIDGLYFDQQQAPTSHLIASATMRVGLAAQGFAFPGPTGVVDYDLRRPGEKSGLSVVAGATGWGGYSFEADGQTPLGEHLSLGLGGGTYHDVYADGTAADYRQIAVIARWRPRPGLEVTPYYEYAPMLANPATAIYLTANGRPPGWLPRDYNGPSWDAYRGVNQNAGLVASAAVTPQTTVRLGVFHSEGTSRSTYAALYLNLTDSGLADRVIIADPPRRYASDSAELRVAQGLAEGPRRHLLLLTLRGRSVESRYGGSDLFDFGTTRIDAQGPAVEPAWNFGQSTRDTVKQWSAGVGYSLDWANLGSAQIGVLHTDYRKSVLTPGSSPATSADAPLLWNASLALELGHGVVAYASHTLGLEESGQAPDVAVNRNALTPAIRTTQTDAGLRWKVTKSMSLVAGVFEVKKPYDAVDGAGYFRRLGALANRGIEVSLTGQPSPAWTVVAGAVFLDAEVSGDAVRSRLIGARPVGSTPVKLQANIEYAVPSAPRWSFDAGVNWRGEVVATTDGLIHLPPRATLDLGARYRFKVAGKPSLLRLQVTNVADSSGYVVLGPGAYKSADGRKALLSLTTDF